MCHTAVLLCAACRRRRCCLSMLARVGVLRHRREGCRPPASTCCAVIEDLSLLRVQATPGTAVLSCAAAVCAACVSFYLGHQKRCLILRKCSDMYKHLVQYVLGQKGAEVLISGNVISHPGR